MSLMIRYSEAKRFTYIKKEHVEKAHLRKFYCVEVPSLIIVREEASLTPIITGKLFQAFTNRCMTQSGLKGTQSAMAPLVAEIGCRFQ